MASKAEAEKVRWQCPLCLDNFKDATLLTCGHTFCKGCLEVYDEQHSDLDHIICPVCRQTTELGPNRVSGLKPNFTVKGVEDEIGGQKASYCSIHKTVYNDIFCVDCEIFICITCYVDTHKNHKIIKREEMGRNLREKGDNLIEKGKTTKTQIEKCLDDATQEDNDIHSHLNNVEKDITDAFTRNVTILQKYKDLLLTRVGEIRKDSDEQSKRYMTHHKQLIDNITTSMTFLKENLVGESSDENTLQSYHLQCCQIENSLKQTIGLIGIESVDHHKQAAESTRFCPADENILALGHIEHGVTSTMSCTQHIKTVNAVRQDEEELQASDDEEIRVLKTSFTMLPLKLDTLKIVRRVDVNLIAGMATLSRDAVVVGYGSYGKGTDCFLVSGEKKPHLKSDVGFVYGIALLTDGRSVVSQGDDTLLVYDKHGEQITDMTYTCTNGSRYPWLCSDQYDNIYAINGTSQVLIFHGNSKRLIHSNRTKPERVLTGNIKPDQICVTKTGVMITSTCTSKPSTVTVFNKKGRVGYYIESGNDDDYLYVAVDSQDRVLVARVRKSSDTIRLTRYTLRGLTLTKELTFEPLRLHEPYQGYWSCMVSLTPNMIAFATGESIYFIDIAA